MNFYDAGESPGNLRRASPSVPEKSGIPGVQA